MSLTGPTKLAFATAVNDPASSNEIIAAIESSGGGGSGVGTVTSVAMTVPSTVFAVAGSPVTSTGSLDLTLLTKAANTVLAGPASGAAAAPTVRSLVAADIPDLSSVYATTANLALKAPLASPSFTGSITIGTLTGIIKGTTGVLSAATEGTDYLNGASNKLPIHVVFAGTGIPTSGTDMNPWSYIELAATVFRFTLTCKTAPTGNFQVTVKRSIDSGATFPDTIATVTVASGAKLATTTTITNAALAAGDVLRCDIISVNGAADWTAKLSTLSRNQ